MELTGFRLCQMIWFFVLCNEATSTYNLSNDMEPHPSRKVGKKSIKAEIVVRNCNLILDTTARPGGNSTCLYYGREYQENEKWIDIENCRICLCPSGNPNSIKTTWCCKMEMIPVKLPKNCQVDPAGRHSNLPPPAQCFAPLTRIGTTILQPKTQRACRSQRLRKKLAGKDWVPSRDELIKFAMSIPRRRSNVRRNAIRKTERNSMQVSTRISFETFKLFCQNKK